MEERWSPKPLLVCSNHIAPAKFPMTIWLDSDGVLMDFNGYFTRLTGKVWDSIPSQSVRWATLNAYPTFYRDLPLLSGARDLWNFLQPWSPRILSAASRNSTCRTQKLESFKHNFNADGAQAVVVSNWREKPDHCTLGDILVDDNERQRAGWEVAGGIFIRFESADQVIDELLPLLPFPY